MSKNTLPLDPIHGDVNSPPSDNTLINNDQKHIESRTTSSDAFVPSSTGNETARPCAHDDSSPPPMNQHNTTARKSPCKNGHATNDPAKHSPASTQNCQSTEENRTPNNDDDDDDGASPPPSSQQSTARKSPRPSYLRIHRDLFDRINRFRSSSPNNNYYDDGGSPPPMNQSNTTSTTARNTSPDTNGSEAPNGHATEDAATPTPQETTRRRQIKTRRRNPFSEQAKVAARTVARQGRHIAPKRSFANRLQRSVSLARKVSSRRQKDVDQGTTSPASTSPASTSPASSRAQSSVRSTPTLKCSTGISCVNSRGNVVVSEICVVRSSAKTTPTINEGQDGALQPLQLPTSVLTPLADRRASNVSHPLPQLKSVPSANEVSSASSSSPFIPPRASRSPTSILQSTNSNSVLVRSNGITQLATERALPPIDSTSPSPNQGTSPPGSNEVVAKDGVMTASTMNNMFKPSTSFQPGTPSDFGSSLSWKLSDNSKASSPTNAECRPLHDPVLQTKFASGSDSILRAFLDASPSAFDGWKEVYSSYSRYSGTFKPLKLLGKGSFGAAYLVRYVKPPPKRSRTTSPPSAAVASTNRQSQSQCQSQSPIPTHRKRFDPPTQQKRQSRDAVAFQKIVDSQRELLAQRNADVTPNGGAVSAMGIVDPIVLITSRDKRGIITSSVSVPRQDLFVCKVEKIQPKQQQNKNSQQNDNKNDDDDDDDRRTRLVQDLVKQRQERSSHEAHILSNIAHPNIVNFVDFYVDKKKQEQEQLLFIEYVDGGDLYHDLVRRRESGVFMNEREILHIFVQVVLAVEYCHRQNILHRDIKSQNVLLSKHGFAKLTDFGTARQFDFDVNENVDSVLMGSPLYLSPEICRGQPYSEKTDMWSLGVLLYEMLTMGSQFPFMATTRKDLNFNIIHCRPLSLSRRLPCGDQVSDPTGILLCLLLEKDPLRRPTALQVLTQWDSMRGALDRYLASFQEILIDSPMRKAQQQHENRKKEKQQQQQQQQQHSNNACASTTPCSADQNWLRLLKDHVNLLRGNVSVQGLAEKRRLLFAQNMALVRSGASSNALHNKNNTTHPQSPARKGHGTPPLGPTRLNQTTPASHQNNNNNTLPVLQSPTTVTRRLSTSFGCLDASRPSEDERPPERMSHDVDSAQQFSTSAGMPSTSSVNINDLSSNQYAAALVNNNNNQTTNNNNNTSFTSLRPILPQVSGGNNSQSQQRQRRQLLARTSSEKSTERFFHNEGQ